MALVALSVPGIMFSMSATAQNLRTLLEQQSRGAAKHLGLPQSAQPLGIPALDRVLPDGGLPRGQVTELAVSAGTGLATSISLGACRAAQEQARHQGIDCWCAFVDPSGSLFAPGVIEAGVDPRKLLVVQPPEEPSPAQRRTTAAPSAINRIAIQLAEARLFSVIIVDIVGATWAADHTRTAPLSPSLSQWGKTIRRIAMAIAGTSTQVLLLTDRAARRTLPLPVALRLELQRRNPSQLWLTVAKDKRGRVSAPQLVCLQEPPANEPGSQPNPTRPERGPAAGSTESSRPRLSVVPSTATTVPPLSRANVTSAIL